jgi:hypothetical protein
MILFYPVSGELSAGVRISPNSGEFTDSIVSFVRQTPPTEHEI